MISPEDAPHTYEYDEHYKILPAIHSWDRDAGRIKDGQKVPEGFCYRSDTNASWMTVPELQAWLAANKDRLGGY